MLGVTIYNSRYSCHSCHTPNVPQENHHTRPTEQEFTQNDCKVYKCSGMGHTSFCYCSNSSSTISLEIMLGELFHGKMYLILGMSASNGGQALLGFLGKIKI
jgi:hypothetical protein